LLRYSIRTTRPSDKLDYLRIGPFRISEVKGLVIFKLDLPKKLRIYPIFYISLLEKAPKDAKIVIPEVEVDRAEYKVERIMAYSEDRDQLYYLVKWKGYAHSDNTWEPASGYREARSAMNQFHRAVPRAPTPKEWRDRGRRRSIGLTEWKLDQDPGKATRRKDRHRRPLPKLRRLRVHLATEGRGVVSRHPSLSREHAASQDEQGEQSDRTSAGPRGKGR
jgi:Chromo (CHRromatin Organisation MOdifier) domain